MMRRGRVTFLALLAAAAAAAPASASEGGIGAPGVGDPFFPLGGNGGIDVRDYALELAYDPATRRLEGTARLSIVATQDLERFDLDLRGFRLGTVTVDGRAAGVLRDGQELMLTPARPLRRGARFTVVVPYSVQMTVPDGLTAVGNGSLAARFSRGGRTTFRWDERYPMAPYLATITLGRFDVARGRTASGIPTYVAVDPTQAGASAPALAKLPDMVSFLEQIYGPYPFETVGAIVDDAPDVG